MQLKTLNYIFVVMFILLISIVLAGTSDVIEFDDGSSSQNLTQNTIKYITLPLNASIEEANISIKGLFSFEQSILKYYNISAFEDNSTQGWVETVYPGSVCLNNVSVCGEFGFSKWEVDAVGNYSLAIRNNGKMQKNFTNISKIVYDIQIKQCNSVDYAYIYVNNSVVKSYTNYQDLTRFYNETILINQTGISVVDLKCKKSGFGCCEMRVDNIRVYKNRFPENVQIQVNSTTVFNHTGNLTGTNHTTFVSALESCNNYENSCPITFSFTNGKLELSNLFIRYNITNAADVNIVSPNQIATTVNNGDTLTVAGINITNTGDWNFTDFNFETISAGGTPNLNDSITSVCTKTNLQNGSSMLCNVTFSNINIAPENDEKIKICGNGTDLDQTLCSNSIDVDITVNSIVSGGGGSGPALTECGWKVESPANRVITSNGWPGYSTPDIPFSIYNNLTRTTQVSYSVQGIECSFEETSQSIEGSSRKINRVKCNYPEKEDTGQIIIQGGGCSQAINVGLYSNNFGYYTLALQGKIGVAQAFLAWIGTLLTISVIIFGLSKVVS